MQGESAPKKSGNKPDPAGAEERLLVFSDCATPTVQHLTVKRSSWGVGNSDFSNATYRITERTKFAEKLLQCANKTGFRHAGLSAQTHSNSPGIAVTCSTS